jgi:hypothetical protein
MPYSPEEEFRLFGKLSVETTERLLDASAKLEAVKDIDERLTEAMAQIPAEDFLEDIKRRLNDLRSNLRGNNRETMGGIIEAIDDLAQCTFNAGDYARSELNKALAVLK